MRAGLVALVLVLLFLLLRNSSNFDAGLTSANPVFLGYGALFVAGIVAAELLRPLLSLLSASSRFLVVVLLVGLVWFGFNQARQSGFLPDLFAAPTHDVNDTLPPVPQTVLRPAWDGVYRTVAEINNRSLGVMIDSATPVVLVQYEEAVRLGLHPETLKFNDRITVSDHKVTAAKLSLASVRIDTLDVHDVDAAIAEKGALETSLIGLSFLNRLKGVVIRNGKMILTK